MITIKEAKAELSKIKFAKEAEDELCDIFKTILKSDGIDVFFVKCSKMCNVPIKSRINYIGKEVITNNAYTKRLHVTIWDFERDKKKVPIEFCGYATEIDDARRYNCID